VTVSTAATVESLAGSARGVDTLGMKPNAYFPLVVLVASSPFASAQLATSWSRVHDAPPSQSDTLLDMAVDPTGRVCVTGRSYNTTSGFPPPPPTSDIETVTYDAAGTQAWRARYHSPLNGDDTGYAIAFAPNGDVLVAGQSGGYVSSTYVTMQTVVRYDSSGNELWANQYGVAAGPNIGRALLVAANGDVFVGGNDGGGNASGNMCVRKLDASGNVLWTATFDGAAGAYDYVYALAQAGNGDIVAVGSTTTAATTTDFALMRVDASGSVLWTREVDGGTNQNDTAFSVAIDAAGNAYAAGQMTTGANGLDQAIRAYDPAGNLLWSSVRDGSAHGADVFRKVAVDRFGRAIAMGGLTQTGAGSDFSVVAYAVGGGVAWARAWGGAANLDDLARGLAIDATGNVYVSGQANLSTTPTTVAEGRVVCYEPNGTERFAFAYGNGVNSERFVDVECGPGDSLYVGGYHDQGVNNGLDYLTLRLERTSSVYCFGDGSGLACPCGNTNTASLSSGCASSLGTGGTLIDLGASSLSGDTFVLRGSNMPSGPCLYFQGATQIAGGLGVAFGDGLRCAGGTTIRLGIKTNVAGASQFPGPSDPPVSLVGLVSTPGTRTYQLWYRDSATFCSAATFNLTNGVRVSWIP